MDFSVALFKQKGIQFPTTFKMRESLDFQKLYGLERQFSEKGIRIETALKRLKQRTSTEYYNHIQAAQTETQKFAINAFPPYKLLLPDVLMDDWLSIMGPHQKDRRDHSLHQPLTAFIISELLGGGKAGQGLIMPSGKTLLEECTRMFLDMPGTQYLRDYFEELYINGLPPEGNIRETWARAIFYHTAIIAAVFHDMGYPWQFLNKVGGNIELVNKEGVVIPASTGSSIMNYIENRLLVYPFYGYSDTPQYKPVTPWERDVEGLIDDAYKNTHGFPGALAFMYLNDAVREFTGDNSIKQANNRFIQDWATVGIMMHDMVGRYYGKSKGPDQRRFRLSIDKDPLSCLIAMADILEEFGRPLAKFSVNNQLIETEFKYPCDSTTVEVKGNTLEITYKYSSKAEKAKNEMFRKNEVEDYFRVPSGYIDLEAIGIERVTCVVK